MEMVEVRLYPGERPGFVSGASAVLSKNCLLLESNHCRLLSTYACTLYPRTFEALHSRILWISKISFLFHFSKHCILVSLHPFKGFLHILCFSSAGFTGLGTMLTPGPCPSCLS